MDDRSDPRGRPTGRHESARYDRDLYSWAVEQAALLRTGHITEADVLNIAAEIDDIGIRQYDKLEYSLRVILLHPAEMGSPAGVSFSQLASQYCGSAQACLQSAAQESGTQASCR
ncbi:MAG: DUF29 family protein [Xanthobacteraceae bacterium]